MIELGAGWVPEFLRNLDMSQKIFKRTDPNVAALPKKRDGSSGCAARCGVE